MKKPYPVTTLSLEKNEEDIALFAAALDNPIRRHILKLLSKKNYSISELSRILKIPDSTISFHAKLLSKAGIITVVDLKQRRGNEKKLSIGSFYYFLNIIGDYARPTLKDRTVTFSVPIGSFQDFKAVPPCGLRDQDESILSTDIPSVFYSPRRMNASLIWMTDGYLEYRFPLLGFNSKRDRIIDVFDKRNIISVSLSFEICAECPQHDEHFQSDITFWVNGKEVYTYECPGDYGGRRGKYTPSYIPINDTQYGDLCTLEFKTDGTYFNNKKVGIFKVSDLQLDKNEVMSFKIGIKDKAKHRGGFNLFGKKCGDYDQDIIVSFSYLE